MIRTNTSERKRALINSRIGQYQVSGFWDPKIFFVNKVNWYFNRIQFKHVQSMKLEKALSARSFFVTWNRVSLFSEDTMQTDCNTLFTRSEYLFYIINLFHPARLICINTPHNLDNNPIIRPYLFRPYFGAIAQIRDSRKPNRPDFENWDLNVETHRGRVELIFWEFFKAVLTLVEARYGVSHKSACLWDGSRINMREMLISISGIKTVGGKLFNRFDYAVKEVCLFLLLINIFFRKYHFRSSAPFSDSKKISEVWFMGRFSLRQGEIRQRVFDAKGASWIFNRIDSETPRYFRTSICVFDFWVHSTYMR